MKEDHYDLYGDPGFKEQALRRRFPASSNIDNIPREQLTKQYQEHIRAIDKRIGENDPKEEFIYKARIQNIINKISFARTLEAKSIVYSMEDQDIIYNLLTRELGK